MSDEIKKGLLGIVVDETTISQVMPDINSLTYRGYAVQDLCEKCSFEEVAYLILNKELPNKTKMKKFKKIPQILNNIDVKDKSMIFNTDLTESLELHNLMAQSKVTLHSALNRTESRGAHAREDHQERDDSNWLVHSLSWLDNKGGVRMGTRPVNMNTLTNHVQPIPPKKRVY